MANSKNRMPTIVDLFAGAGGLSEGFRQAGFLPIAANEIDPDACATYRLNFPEARVICGDVRDKRIFSQLLEASVGADVVVGGPPCQAFSQLRNHARVIDDPRNVLYKEFVRIVRRIMPKAFLMENVTGIDQMGFRDQIVADLELNGEYIVLAQIIDAAEVGSPQTRKRLIFIGVRRSLSVAPPIVAQSGITKAVSLERLTIDGCVKYKITENKSAVSGGLIRRLKDSKDLYAVTAKQSMSDLRFLKVGNRNDAIPYDLLPLPESAYQEYMRQGAGEVLHNVQVPRMLEDTTSRLRSIPAGGNYRDLPDKLTQRNLTEKRWGPQNGTGVLSRRHFYAYRRLHPEIWSWTLNTKADCVYHYKEIRALSVREFARLHSFPDRFVFSTDSRVGLLVGRHSGGSAHSRYRQVGNAVPPLLAKACAEALMSILFSRSVKSKKDAI